MVKPPSSRPTTAGYSARNSNYGVYGSKSAAASSDRDEMVGIEFNQSNTQLTANESSNEKPSYNVSFDLMAELEELRARVSEEEITTQKVLDELASNETLQYIQKLEAENERLRKDVLSYSNQLLGSKVLETVALSIRYTSYSRHSIISNTFPHCLIDRAWSSTENHSLTADKNDHKNMCTKKNEAEFIFYQLF